MKNLLMLPILLLSMSLYACNKDDEGDSTQTDKTYQLVFSDEFDYSGLPDKTKWTMETGGDGWGNKELQYYTNSQNNATVSNGTLKIRALYESYGSNAFTSARLNSVQNWTYGKMEIKAKIPKGKGTWPAIWMLGANIRTGTSWPGCGEIDIMEHVGKDLNRVHGSIHCDAYNHPKGTQKTANLVIPTATTEFHVYSIEWTSEQIDFYIDGQKYLTFKNEHKTNAEWPFNKPQFMLLNVAVGGGWGGPDIDYAAFPQYTFMEIDYVRVYQKK